MQYSVPFYYATFRSIVRRGLGKVIEEKKESEIVFKIYKSKLVNS